MCKSFQEKCEKEISQLLQNYKFIIRYTYDRKGKSGVLVGFKILNQIYLGWSKVNKSLDKWNRNVALWLAFKRAIPIRDAMKGLKRVPISMQADYMQMYQRIKRYFRLNESHILQ